ncbi:MAG: rod shape-determining protein MreD [Sphingomonadales bacterium]
MISQSLEQIDQSIRAATPFLWCLFWGLVELLPFNIVILSPVTPALLLISAYFWTISRPDLMPPLLLFLLGVIHDLWSGGPFGLTPLTLILMHGFVVSQRRLLSRRLFVISWVGFVIVAAGFGVVGWTLASFHNDGFLNPVPTAFQILLSIALYPVMARLMAGFQRRILD